MTHEEISRSLQHDRVIVQCRLPGDQDGVVALNGVPRAITDARGYFFPDAGEEHLWLTSALEHFIPFRDIVRIDPVVQIHRA